MRTNVRALAIIAVLVGVRVGAGLLSGDPDTSVPAPPASGLGIGVVLDAAAEAEVRELAEVVAELRGLSWKYEPEVMFLEPDAFDAVVRPRDNPFVPDEVTPDDHLYRSLGQLPADATLASGLETFAVDGIDGFYEPSIDTLVVSGTTIDDYTRVVLVHELAHALDAQYYDLGIVSAATTHEELLGARGLVEGSAERVEAAYLDTLSPSDRAAYDAAADTRYDDSADFESMPEVFLAAQAIPYQYGRAFVDALVAEGGEAAIAQAFDDPPRTSADMMHPQRYLDRTPAHEVPTPATPGEIHDTGIFGEGRLLGLLIEQADSSDPVLDWADGWIGDSYALGTGDDGASCIAITIVVASATDADELLAGLDRWADAHPPSTLSRSDDRTLDLSTC